MDDHVAWDELAAGYALHALSPEDAQAFGAHLESCARCRASLDDHALVAAQLGAIAMPETEHDAPSWASIRNAVLADDAGTGPGDRAADPLPARLAGIVDLSATRRRYDVSRRVLAAAAALVVLAGGGIVAWRMTAGSGGPTAPVAGCAKTAGCHSIELDSAAGSPAATLTVQGDKVTMVPSHMKPAPAGSEYVLWQQPADGRPVPIGVFTATGSSAVATDRTQVAYADTTSFAVSKEKSGPVPSRPTTPLLAVGTAT